MTSKATGTGSLREQQQARAKESLLRATLDIISVSGADGVSIDRVTLASGLSRGTLYAHCPGGRDELLQRAYGHIGQIFTESAEAHLIRRSGWEPRILAYAEAMVELCSDPELGIFYNISGPSSGLGSSGGQGSRATQEFIARELTNARQDGQIDSGIDVADSSTLLTGCLRELGMTVALNPGKATGLVAAFKRILAGLRTASGAD